MATSQAREEILLFETDVPGAALEKNKSICSHSKVQLKRWLQCRGLLVGGKKTQLVERILACQGNGGAAIVNYIDSGVWYKKKSVKSASDSNNNATNSRQFSPVVPQFPVLSWKKFPSQKIPSQFSYGVIYKHIIETAVLVPANKESDSDESKENQNPQFNTSKPMRKGRCFFLSGHVQKLEDNLTKDGHFCLKSEVMASFQDKIYKVMIMLDKNLGTVLDSSCECSGSALGRCSHIAGLLYTLEDYTIEFGFEPVSCTSKLCLWNKGRSKKKTPTTISAKQYSNKRDQLQVLSFKPDPENYSYDPNDSINTLLSEVVHLGDGSLWTTILNFTYSNYKLTEERRIELNINIGQLMKALSLPISPGEVPNTNGQSENEKWHLKRKFYVTASTAKTIYKLEPSGYAKKVMELLWSSRSFKSKFTHHGIINEPVARTAYQDKYKFTVETTGMWVNSKYPGLSCSPDGIVYDHGSRSKGLLEIKCPYILKDFFPNDIEKLTREQRYNFCCTKDSLGNLKLKEDHTYYFQIQMCMAILEVQWCDFVIYTSKSFHCQRIKFNPAFWESIFPKLCFFHKNVISVEYFEMRLPRQLDLFIF